jgi:predicted membrane metal-binding protein
VEEAAARRSALRHVLDTFFEGSAAGAMAALLGGDGGKLSQEELARMEALLQKARKEGR